MKEAIKKALQEKIQELSNQLEVKIAPVIEGMDAAWDDYKKHYAAANDYNLQHDSVFHQWYETNKSRFKGEGIKEYEKIKPQLDKLIDLEKQECNIYTSLLIVNKYYKKRLENLLKVTGYELYKLYIENVKNTRDVNEFNNMIYLTKKKGEWGCNDYNDTLIFWGYISKETSSWYDMRLNIKKSKDQKFSNFEIAETDLYINTTDTIKDIENHIINMDTFVECDYKRVLKEVKKLQDLHEKHKKQLADLQKKQQDEYNFVNMLNIAIDYPKY